ncbi:MAG: hypothetical protein AABW79_01905 [Nanoarchaeota archaeon]
MDKYEQLVERIASSTGVSSEEIDRKIEAKRAKLSGLISKEGAAQIVAAELGVSFDNQRMKLGELSEGMRRARVLGKITKVFPVKSYEKNGRSGKIGSFSLGDESSNVRIVLWDNSHIDLVDNGTLKEGDVVEISNAAVRNGELHLSAFSEVKKSEESIGEVKENVTFVQGSFKEPKAGASMKARAVIVQLFDPKYFDGKDGEKRALVNAVLDDGFETIRAVLGPEQIMQLGISEEELFSLEKYNSIKGNFLGEERFFGGVLRMNSYFNKVEFSVKSIEGIDVDSLVKELEQKV